MGMKSVFLIEDDEGLLHTGMMKPFKEKYDVSRFDPKTLSLVTAKFHIEREKPDYIIFKEGHDDMNLVNYMDLELGKIYLEIKRERRIPLRDYFSDEYRIYRKI